METDGRAAEATVAVPLPLHEATETDMAGTLLANATLQDDQLRLTTEPWKIRTFRLQ